MKIKKKIFICAIILFSIFAITSAIKSILSGPVTHADQVPIDVHKAIQQTAYSYYMRGARFQYNSLKANSSYYSPEEATVQNMNYVTCSAFVKNVYYDLLGVKIPPYTASHLTYAKNNRGPEVILYGKRKNGKNIMDVYDKNTGERITLENPTTDDIIPYLEIGDILTYTGHTMIVYDLIYDNNHNVVNARTMESGHGNSGYSAITKISKTTKLSGLSFGSSNHTLYINSRTNTRFADGLLEGSIHLSTFKDVSTWKDLAAATRSEYSILRFLTEEDGNAILTYHGESFSEKDYSGVFEFPQKTLDRLKFNNLFIEKTVDVFMDSVVEAGDQLTYTIEIENKSNADYLNDIHVREIVSPYADYVSYESNKNISFAQNTSNGELSWNIGKLSSGEKITIQYTVKVKTGSSGQTIESVGYVENIPSAVIRNSVQQNLTRELSNKIKDEYENLKGVYAGKQLINEIYKNTTGEDLGINQFEIQNLVQNEDPLSTNASSLSLNAENPFYDAVLSKYWSTIYKKKYTYGDEDLYEYDMKSWGAYNTNRRADTIYEENFRTGDILIYTNRDDIAYTYTSSTDTVDKKPVTKENGEYIYIYIEGKGFVGVNYGDDGIVGTDDDRNSFTPDYYSEKGLQLYSNLESLEAQGIFSLDFVNYQTLFGKDSYVILRPSMIMELAKETEEEPSTNPAEPSDPTNPGPDDKESTNHAETPDTGIISNSEEHHEETTILSPTKGLIVVPLIFVGYYIYRKRKIYKTYY
ncbi:DUF11 domain-containing protein [Candidatus Saccharibacteria bacterium]|nr:DUF11 domain-containing protein [Candidatus Saccharibacteria bacterium]